MGYNKPMGYVLLGDIKGSKQLDTRKLHKTLNSLCKKVNHKFKLSAPMVITLGDEWQMVCATRRQCLEVIEYTKKLLDQHHIEFRAVIGPYSPNTKEYNSVTKFNALMKKSCCNPLICLEFRRAHDKLNEKK